MNKEWKLLPIGECLNKVIDNRGKTPPTVLDRTPYGLIEINALVGDYKFPNYAAIRKFVEHSTYKTWFRAGHPTIGDVIFSTVGSIAEVAIYNGGNGCIAQNLIALRPNKSIIDSNFLYYTLINPETRNRLKSLDISSVQPSIKLPHLLKCEIVVPDLAIQQEITSTLSPLDDRITLLRETNATLEAIAQALFKSWFVDFDPVRAKAEGRQPEGMDVATAALFPDGFEESELGMVPRGWSIFPIGELVDCVGGATPDTKDPNLWEPAIHAWTTPKDLSGQQSPILLETERKISDEGLKKISSGLQPAGTLLMSSRAPIGYLTITQTPVAINQGYIAMPPGGKLSPLFLLYWSKENMEIIKGRANGSTFMEISKKAFRPIPCCLPSKEVLTAFDNTINPIFDRLVANEKQSKTLTTIRDTLLPRLISGQLRLPEAQTAVEEALA